MPLLGRDQLRSGGLGPASWRAGMHRGTGLDNGGPDNPSGGRPENAPGGSGIGERSGAEGTAPHLSVWWRATAGRRIPTSSPRSANQPRFTSNA